MVERRKMAVQADEEVVSAPLRRELVARVRDLECLLGRKMLEFGRDPLKAGLSRRDPIPGYSASWRPASARRLDL